MIWIPDMSDIQAIAWSNMSDISRIKNLLFIDIF